MTHGSLFSGIGGFDLAAEWMGWENKFHCEWNSFGQKVLKYYWPEAESFEDITKTDFTKYANRIDILTGGFPCQPYSLAGKRKGKDDDRHLWPQMCRAIREIKPRWVVGENVLGLVNWNGGLVFHEVQSDLEAEGYEVFPYVLPAASVNAPHRRDRIWFVAYNHNFRCNRFSKQTSYRTNSEKQIRNNQFCKEQRWDEIRSINERNSKNSSIDTNSECVRLEYSKETRNIRKSKGKTQSERSEFTSTIKTDSINGDVTDSDGIRLRTQSNRIGKSGFSGKNEPGNCWETFPTVSPICDGDDGIPDRLDSITFPKWRKESIMAGGNAIVPQVVYQIFKAIELYERGTAI